MVVSDSRLDGRESLLRELGISRPADDVGDGELVHAAWQRWGTKCADRLRGDFAFALWSPGQQTIYCARDPMGVRPFLFHFAAGKRFVFGSSVAAVLAQGQVPTRFDEGRIADALFGETEGIDQTSTFYSSVKKLPPASWLRISSGGRMELQRYWQPVGDRPKSLPRSTEEWIEAQREQLDRAVRLRLRSHRPVGSMLSGGLDSSSVVALASEACAAEGRPPFPVFSATNAADPYCAETRSIHAVLSQRHCRATLVDSAALSSRASAEWWNSCGEPFDAGMPLVAELYRAASSRGVVSLMDGVPADNLFVTGHYAKRLFDRGCAGDAWRAAVTQWTLPQVRHPHWHALRVMVGCFSPKIVHAMRETFSEAVEYRALKADSFASSSLTRRVGMRGRYHRYRQTIAGSHHWHPTDEALSAMAAPYITAGIERYNRIASYFGVEPRPAFADRDLIEFHAWVPIALRTRDGHPKWILRKARRGRLPQEVAWRRDKSNIGWIFNRVFLDLYLVAMDASSLEHGSADWLNLSRLKAALQETGGTGTQGFAAAIRTLAWIRRQPATQQHID